MTTDAKQIRKTRFRRALRRFVIYLILLALGLIIGGFIAFSSHVTRLKSPTALPKADGIVVWTGKGGGRLAAGGQLLTNEKAERLLISGVNKNNSREAITDLLGINPDLSDCCVDLDYAAINTVGNAHETAVWAEALGYEHIILVTSSYHMPRAKTELSVSAPDLYVTAYPVASESKDSWQRLVIEYGKLLLTYAREPRSRDS